MSVVGQHLTYQEDIGVDYSCSLETQALLLVMGAVHWGNWGATDSNNLGADDKAIRNRHYFRPYKCRQWHDIVDVSEAENQLTAQEHYRA